MSPERLKHKRFSEKRDGERREDLEVVLMTDETVALVHAWVAALCLVC